MTTRTTTPWGRETLWAQTRAYAAKILEIDAGHRTSMQHHQHKEETLMVLSGTVRAEVEVDGAVEERLLQPGDVLHLPPGVRHRFEAVAHATLVEVSTPELDDVVRHHDDYGRVPAR